MKKDVLAEAKAAQQAEWLPAERKFRGAYVPADYDDRSWPSHNDYKPQHERSRYRFPTTAITR